MPKKLSIEDLKNHAKSKGGECLSSSYSNNRTKYEWKCEKGHTWKAPFSNIKNNNAWCPKCYQDRRKSLKKYSLKDLQNYAKTNNGILLSKTYTNSGSKYLWKCEKNHTWEAVWASVKHYNSWCPKCARASIVQNQKTKLSTLRKAAKERQGKLISKIYKNNKQKLVWECSKGHRFELNWNDVNDGHWCRSCAQNESTFEHSFEEFVNNKVKYVKNYRPEWMNGKELDFYFPEQNLAVELCGLYWHSEEFKPKKYHINKLNLCEKEGVKLITIFEDEWNNRRVQVKSFIKSALNLNSIRIGARQCELRSLSKETYKTFMNNTHIQGYTPANIRVGLYYKGELVGAMGVGKHHRSVDKTVLNRLAFKENTTVAGGTSKMLKEVRKRLAKQKTYNLITWSDNRWSSGKVYKKAGFELTENLPEDYSYVYKSRSARKSKQSLTKARLKELGAKGKTEKEMAKSLNLLRIWDCGKKRWCVKF